MIPLRDINPTRSRPLVTYTLIAINTVVFLYQSFLGEEGGREFVERFGMVPYWLTQSDPFVSRVDGGGLGSWITPVTSMFMHGGILHLLGNMWFLHVFGDNVEDVLGKIRFFLFYIASGLAAVLAQALIDPTSQVPMVGASGAIAGVLAGYVTLFPRARVLTLVPIFILLQTMEFPAFFFIFIWFGYQLLMGFTSLGQMGNIGGGVAFFAHIGGFLAGLILIHVFRRKRNPTERFRSPVAHSRY